MTRPILVLVFFMLLAAGNYSQPPLAWAEQLDSKNQNSTWCKDIAGVDVDKSGNMYLAGRYSDTMDADPSSVNFYLNCHQNNGAGYILKFSSSGKLTWAKEIILTDSAGLDITTIKVDTLGNVYVAGDFLGTVDFDPGPATYSLNGYADGFVMKLDQAGNFLWAKQFKTTPGSKLDSKHSVVREIIFDINVNPCMVGEYYGSVDMDPGPQTFDVQGKAPKNVFVTKLNSKGDFKWAKSFEGVPFVYDIKYDKHQNIFFCGNTGSGADFDPGNPVVSSKGTAGYLCKLDSIGNFIKTMFFEGNCFVTSLVIADKILFAGQITGITDVNPGVNDYLINPASGSSGFFASLDSLNNFVWAKEIAGAGPKFSGNNIRNIDIQIKNNKDIFLSSTLNGTYDFDPGSASYTLNTATFSSNMSLSSYDQHGNFIWVHLLPNDYGDAEHRHSKVTPEGDIYSASLFSGIFDFDPDITNYYMTPLNTNAIYLRKLSECKNPPTITLTSDKTQICKGEEVWLTASGGDSYTWNYNFQPVPVIITAPQSTILYQVTGMDNKGCKSSADVLITVNECAAINEINSASSSYYPNPTNDIVNFTNHIHGEIKITDITGKLAKEIAVSSDEKSIDLSELPPGIYFLDFRNQKGETFRSKIIRK